MSIGPWQILIVLAIVLLLFGGRGKISSIMGDLANGIRSFKKNMNEEDEEAAEAQRLKDERRSAPHADMAAHAAHKDETARS